MKELKLNDISVTSCRQLSNVFNGHLITLHPKLLMRYPLLLIVQVVPITLLVATSSFSGQFVVAMFFFFLNKLSKSKATGFYDISTKLIKEGADL